MEEFMVGDSSNLIDLIREQLTGEFSNKIASVLGESREKTERGMSAAVPGVLSGLESAASTNDGARRLADAVDSADDSMLSNTTGKFGRTFSSEGGVGTLRSILGDTGLSELAG